MKPSNILYRLFICFSVSISICHPALQLSGAESIESNENSEYPLLKGSLSNGMQYSIIPSDMLKGGTWIQLTCSSPVIDENSALPVLTQHALFYGTEQYSREEIAAKLNGLGLDIDADSYVLSHESAQNLQFSLSAASPQQLAEVLELFNQLALHPTLENGDIEIARSHLLEQCENENEALSLRSVTAYELKDFHAEQYQPGHMHLTIIGMGDAQETLPLIAQSFGAEVVSAETIVPQHPSKPNSDRLMLDDLVQKVDWTADSQFIVVDGKIWMNEPNWINKSSNGKTLGAVLTVIGIAGMIIAFSGIAPVVIIAGGLSTGTGIYFLASDYLKDPYYVESVRKTDLQYGCAYAYKKGRAGITLTPYERRASFLQEMVDHPQTLPKLPILLLADLYQLNDPVIAQIFTVDEFNVLSTLKRDFIQQRNQYKFLRENLEKELAAITAPYAMARDASLLHAQDIYNQNYYVMSKATLKLQRDASIADIERAYKDHDITLDEKEAMIKQSNAYFDACINSPEFKSGLNTAEMNLAQAQLEINATYSYQVEVAKQTIQFNQRMEYYKQGEQSLINYFNQELHNLLASFPVYFTIFPDYLDLRNL